MQGLDKQETVDKYGKDQVLIWRRSYDIPPPVVDKSSPHHPANDPRYAGTEFPEEFTESLAITLDRVLPLWENEIAPILKDGKTVMIAAHGNSLRALVKHLDGIDEGTIAELNIPTGTPLVYELDDSLKPIPQPGAIAPLQGRYLGDQEAIKARIEGVKVRFSRQPLDTTVPSVMQDCSLTLEFFLFFVRSAAESNQGKSHISPHALLSIVLCFCLTPKFLVACPGCASVKIQIFHCSFPANWLT